MAPTVSAPRPGRKQAVTRPLSWRRGPGTLPGRMALSVEELRFFKRNGYLIKRKVMDPDLMAQARRRLWGTIRRRR